MTQRIQELGYLLTALGIVSIIIALVTEQSEYDPVAFGIATVGILLAIVGISLAFKLPPDEKTANASAHEAK